MTINPIALPFMVTIIENPAKSRTALYFGGHGLYCAENFFKLQENSPTKVGAQFLRHQLRTEVRSMVHLWLRHQLLAKAYLECKRACVQGCNKAKALCPCHWLQPVVDDEFFLSAEFIRRLKILPGGSCSCTTENFQQRRSAALQSNEIFRRCGSTTFQKNHSPFAAVFGSAGALLSRFV